MLIHAEGGWERKKERKKDVGLYSSHARMVLTEIPYSNLIDAALVCRCSCRT